MLSENKSTSSKLIIKLPPFFPNFVKEAYLQIFGKNESKEASFKENVHVFSVDYAAIYKSDILDIHSYLIIKNNI